jgi:hypothetical protein
MVEQILVQQGLVFSNFPTSALHQFLWGSHTTITFWIACPDPPMNLASERRRKCRERRVWTMRQLGVSMRAATGFQTDYSHQVYPPLAV